MKCMQNIFGCPEHLSGVVRSKFSCVHSSHSLCARAHTHSLEGTLVHGGLAVSMLAWFGI